MQLLLQSLLLICSFAFIFIWQNTFLSQYTLILLVVLLAFYAGISLRRKNFDLVATLQNELLGLIVLNTVIVLVVMMSGNFSSPLFFLLYFLAFGIMFVYEPASIFVFSIGIFTLLFPYTFKEDITRNILMLGSLIAVATLAFFGQTYIKKNQ